MTNAEMVANKKQQNNYCFKMNKKVSQIEANGIDNSKDIKAEIAGLFWTYRLSYQMAYALMARVIVVEYRQLGYALPTQTEMTQMINNMLER